MRVVMKKNYKEIWDIAQKYQDKRNDKGHAEITLGFAQHLLSLEEANPDIVIPAIILHDVGWGQLPAEERFLADRLDTPPQKFKELRLRHQKEGIKLAKAILKQISYDQALSEYILEIISQHDTRVGSFSKDDALVRDADKLWRFSNIGFWIVIHE